MDEKAIAARRAYRNAWAKKNKDKIRAYRNKWAKHNPDKIREYQERYWTKKAAQAEGETPAAAGSVHGGN